MKNSETLQGLSALAIAIGLSIPQLASAVNFNIGDIEGQFDSNISIGASWSTQSPKTSLMHSASSDDGRRNFEKGKTFSKIFKGIHDLELKYRDSGLFVRGKYWYDFELKDEDRVFKDISDHNRKEGAKSAGAELMDAFLYHNYMIDEMPGHQFRAGRFRSFFAVVVTDIFELPIFVFKFKVIPVFAPDK